ncbi:ATP-binding protein [Enterobacterales bacterium AW_CKDN230030176-1A_HGKHYDSX7]
MYFTICVIDDGVGMSYQTLARAFESFFTTKPVGAGTGLGLSMTYGFTKQSGGQVRIKSEEGRGARVHPQLPIQCHIKRSQSWHSAIHPSEAVQSAVTPPLESH